jgi:hypothetical protein
VLAEKLKERFGCFCIAGEEDVPIALRAAAMHPEFGHFPYVTDAQRDAIWHAVLTDAVQLSNANQHAMVCLPPRSFAYMTQDEFSPDRDILSAALRRLRARFEEMGGQPCASPLLWWQERIQQSGHTLALLGPVARMYLALPGSSADLERSFSSAGFILEGRFRLLPRNLEAQAVIRDYLLYAERTLPPEAYQQLATGIIAALTQAQDPAAGAAGDGENAAAPVLV